MLHAATTFEGCTTCRPREGQQSSVEWLLMTALIESLNKLVNKTSKSYLVYLNLINSDYFLGFQIGLGYFY